MENWLPPDLTFLSEASMQELDSVLLTIAVKLREAESAELDLLKELQTRTTEHHRIVDLEFERDKAHLSKTVCAYTSQLLGVEAKITKIQSLKKAEGEQVLKEERETEEKEQEKEKDHKDKRLKTESDVMTPQKQPQTKQLKQFQVQIGVPFRMSWGHCSPEWRSLQCENPATPLEFNVTPVPSVSRNKEDLGEQEHQTETKPDFLEVWEKEGLGALPFHKTLRDLRGAFRISNPPLLAKKVRDYLYPDLAQFALRRLGLPPMTEEEAKQEQPLIVLLNGEWLDFESVRPAKLAEMESRDSLGRDWMRTEKRVLEVGKIGSGKWAKVRIPPDSFARFHCDGSFSILPLPAFHPTVLRAKD